MDKVKAAIRLVTDHTHALTQGTIARRKGGKISMTGELMVVAGIGNKLRAAMSQIAPGSTLADLHGRMASPGKGKAEEPLSTRERTDRLRA